MGDLNIAIDFSTNANAVKAQIASLNKEAENAAAKQYRLEAALRNNKATTKALVGERSLKKGILALDKEIGSLAQKRANAITAPYQKALGPQRAFVTGLVKQNEVMRIQTKIAKDNATAMVNLGKNTQWAGRQLVVGFTVPLTIAAGAAMKAFSDLEKEMVRFKRVYGDVSTTGSELKQAADDVRNLAMEWTKYGVAVSDTIAVAADAAGAGFAGDKLTSQVNAATKLAVLGELDKQAAMKTTIALQSTYRMSNEELGQSINYLNQLENQTMVTMQDMVTAIPKAGTVVEGLGGSVKDLGTFLAAMEEGGVTAAEAANALKSGLGSLLNPSVKAREQLAGIGVELDALWAKSEKSGGGVMEVVTNLAAALEQLGQTQKQQVIEEIFGKHQFARMNALLSNINSGTQAAQAQTVASASQLEAALISQKELGKFGESSLTKFQSSVERLKKSLAPIGEQVMKAATFFVNMAEKILSAFDALPDSFKKFGLSVVGIGGIIAPLFIMLIGQAMNFYGTLKQVVNAIKSWHKGLGWVEADSVSMVNVIQKMNNNLLQQNLILQQNAKLWGSIVRPTTMPIGGVGGGPSKPIRRNTGGSIPGSGNTDTVPALLTPGEYVVRKSVAQKFGPVLAAMNSGRLQGFNGGTEDAKTSKTAIAAAERKKRAEEKAKIEEEKAKAFTAVRTYKLNENEVVSRIYQDVKQAAGGLLTFSNLSNWLRWDQSHIGSVQAKQETFKQPGYKKEWNYQGDLILDNHMINLNVPHANNHPTDLPEVTPVHEIVKNKLSRQKVNPNNLITERLLAWRRGNGKEFYTELMDENFRFMNLVGAGKGKGNTTKVRTRINKMARGGFVPGTGNGDTVPSLLTPGEAVIKKSAAQKFGPILEAMNSGRLKGFVEGVVPGPMGPDYGKALGALKLSVADRQGIMKPFFDAVSGIVKEMSDRFKLTAQEMDQLEYELVAEYTRDNATGEASHAFRARDAEGNQFWSPDNLAFTPKMENNFMEQLTKSQHNQKMLNDSIVRQAKATNLSTDEINKRRAVVARVAAGEHMLEEAERKLLGEMLLETKEYQMTRTGAAKFSESIQNNLIPIGGTLTRVVPNAHSGERWGPEQTAAARPHGMPIGGGQSDTGSEVELAKSKRDFTAAKMMAMNAMWMFSSQLTGLTEKMGSFGAILSQVIMMAPMLSMSGIPGGGGFKGIIGRGTPAAGAGRMKGAYGRWGLTAGGVGGAIGAGAGAIAGNAIGGTGGSAVRWGATGAGLGAMFGPWGIAIGGAVGAIAGFTTSLIQSRRAIEESKEAMRNSASAWNNITNELVDKFDLGSGFSINDLLTSVPGLDEEQADISKQLLEAIEGEGAWADRVNELNTAARNGQMQPGQMQQEIANSVLDLRAKGVDEESIEAIVKTLILAVAPEARQGLTPDTVAIESTNEILARAASLIPDLANEAFVSIRQAGENLNAMYTGAMPTPEGEDLYSMKGKLDARVAQADIDFLRSAELISGATNALTHAYLNAKGKERKELANQIKETQALGDQLSIARYGLGDEQRTSVEKAAGQDILDIVAQGEGLGMTAEIWADLSRDFGGNIFQLGEAGAALLNAGIAIQDMTGQQMILAQNALVGEATAKAEVEKYSALQAEDKAAMQKLNSAYEAMNKRLKDEAIQIEYEIASIPLQRVEAQLEVTQIQIEARALGAFVGKFNRAFGQSINSFADAQYQIDKIGARISRIQQDVIGPLQDKIQGMNRANELAQRKLDAIDAKREARADRINKRYDARADSIEKQQDALEKSNEALDKQYKRLDDRNKKLDKQVKGLDKENEALDEKYEALEKQEEMLEQIRRQNDFIFDQQKNSVDMANALAKGDIASAVNAMIMSNQNVAGFGAGSQDQALQTQRDQLDVQRAEIDSRRKAIDDKREELEVEREILDKKRENLQADQKALQKRSEANEKQRKALLERDRWAKQYEKISGKIEKRQESIRDLEDRVYRINKNQVQPLERKQDLMSRMLSNSKRELANQQANANGLDAENLARERALLNAQKTLKEAKANRGVVGDIKDEYNEIANGLKKQYKTSTTHYDELHASIKASDKDHGKRSKDALELAKKYRAQIENVRTGADLDIPLEGTTADIMADVLYYLDTGKFRKKSAKKRSKKPTNGYGTNNPSVQTQPSGSTINSPSNPSNRYAGGMIPGKGGQDSVPAMLTPGEFVMRKSAVDRIGTEKLRLLNQGDPNTNPNIDLGGRSMPSKYGKPYSGDSVQKFAKGGKVKHNPFINVGEKASPKLKDALPKSAVNAVAKPDAGSTASTPTGPISIADAKARNQALARGFESRLGHTSIDGHSVGGMCARNVGLLYRKYVGWPLAAGQPTAHAAGNVIQSRGLMRSGYGPRGSIAYWTNAIGGGSGHVAVNDGYGNSLNNWGSSSIVKTHLSRQRTGYRGWSYYFGDGGLVPGDGGGDIVPSMLTPGEFVLNKAAVKSIGTAPLSALNSSAIQSGNAMPSMGLSDSVTEGDVVYNYEYNLSFAISEASDANEVANVVINKINSASRSRVRSR